MSRFGTGLGFNKYNASLWGGGTEIFTANVANFNGSTSHAEVTNGTLLSNRTALTISARFNLSTLSQVAVVSEALVGTGSVVNIYVNTDGSMRAQVTGSGDKYTTAGSIEIDTDYHILMEYSASTFINMEINRVQKLNATTGIPSSTGSVSGSRLLVGATGTASSEPIPFNGDLFKVEIFDRILTTDEKLLLNGLVSKCYELYTQDMKDDCILASPQYNHAGFIGQEFTDQTGINTITPTDIAFTGSAHIECEA